MSLIKRFGKKKGSVMLIVLGTMTLLIVACTTLFFSLSANSDEVLTEVKNQQVYLAAESASNFTVKYILNACAKVNAAGQTSEAEYTKAMADHKLLDSIYKLPVNNSTGNGILKTTTGNFAFDDESYEIEIEHTHTDGTETNGTKTYEVRTKASNSEGITKTFTNGFRINVNTVSNSNDEEDTPFKYGLMSIDTTQYTVIGTIDFPYYIRSAGTLNVHGGTYFNQNIYANGNVNIIGTNAHLGYSNPINIFVAGTVKKDPNTNKVISVAPANVTTDSADYYFLDRGGNMFISGDLDLSLIPKEYFGINTDTSGTHAHIWVQGNVKPAVNHDGVIKNTTFHVTDQNKKKDIITGAQWAYDFNTAEITIDGTTQKALDWLGSVPEYSPKPWSYKTVPKNNITDYKYSDSEFQAIRNNTITISASSCTGNGVTQTGSGDAKTTTIKQSGTLSFQQTGLGVISGSGNGHTVIFDTTKGTADNADDDNMFIFLKSPTTGANDDIYLFDIGAQNDKFKYVNYLVKGAGSLVFVIPNDEPTIKTTNHIMFGERTFVGHYDWANVWGVSPTSALYQKALADVGNNVESPPILTSSTSKVKGMTHKNENDGETASNCWYCNNPDQKTKEKWVKHSDALLRVNGMLKKYGSDNASVGTAPTYDNKAGNYSMNYNTDNPGDLHPNIYLCDMRGFTVTTGSDGKEIIQISGTGIENNYFQNSVGGYFLYIYSPGNNLTHISTNVVTEGQTKYTGQVMLGGAICKNLQLVGSAGTFKLIYVKPSNYYSPGIQSWNSNNFVYAVDKLTYPPPLDAGDPTGFTHTEYVMNELGYYN